jgi:3-oxoacyl-[acyl-carrier-protein] synthase-3
MRRAGVLVPDGFLSRLTGIEARRIVADGENASDLAVAAAREALAEADVDPRDVDVLVFCAASHDITEPATANIVQAKLEATNAVVFDVKNACNSFLSALDVADAYITSGRARTILLASGEVPSIVVDRRIRSRADLTERFSHLTMGDAGGAILVAAMDDPNRGMLATAAVTRGEAWKLGTVLSFGTMYPHDITPARAFLHADSCALERQARRDIPTVMRAAMEAAGWAPSDVDVIACHQHTRKIAHELAVAAGVSADRLSLPLRYAGNAAAANVPLALVHAKREGRLAPGTRALLCGGSAGFSAIASAIVW